jgi:hypothetical protein
MAEFDAVALASIQKSNDLNIDQARALDVKAIQD